MDSIERFFQKLVALFDDHQELKRKVEELSDKVQKLEKQNAHKTVSNYLKEMQTSYTYGK